VIYVDKKSVKLALRLFLHIYFFRWVPKLMQISRGFKRCQQSEWPQCLGHRV